MSHKHNSISPSSKQNASVRAASNSQSAKDISQNERAQGNAYFKAENFKLAIEHYSKAIDTLQGSAESAELASLYNNRAMTHIKLEEWEQAVRDATQSISLNDKESRAFYRRGLARHKLNQLDGAIQDFEDALKLSPRNQEISNALLQAKQALSQSELNETKRPLSTTKSSSAAPLPAFRGDSSILKKSNELKEKGANLFKAGQHAESIGLFSQALEVLLGAKSPEFYVEQIAALYNNRAAAHSQVAQHKAAVQDCNSCMEFIRTHADAPLPSNLVPILVKSLMRRAFAYEALEMPNQALIDMQEALALDPLSNNQQAIASVGRLTNAARKHNQIVVQEAKIKGNSFFEKNDYSAAIECYTRALSVCGVSPLAGTSEKARSPEEAQDVLKILTSLGVQNVELLSVPIQAQVNDKAAVVSLLCNRALAFLRLRRFTAAIVDCSRALERDQHNQKALLRRGLARKGLGEHLSDRQLCLSALDDLKRANELDLKNTISQEITTVENLLATL